MAECVRGTRRAYSVGNLMLYVQPLTLVSDGSTHASALNGIVGYWTNVTSETDTSVKAGCDISLSNSTFTINSSQAVLKRSLDLYILTTELE